MPPPAKKPSATRTDAPDGMPRADQALEPLIERFRRAPSSGAFVDLAAALLARGHAAEALRVAEHGLQREPTSTEGRVERAAALLALGRPRVAYVELRRALALAPEHRRGLRLLGRAFRDAGAPGRAAELLARRFEGADDTVPSTVAFPPAAATEPDAPLPSEPAAHPSPNLFSNLTVDLGLGAAIPEEVPQRRVEITQIIRRKGIPRPPRSASELVAIEGPIVDTTHPGQIVRTEAPGDEVPLEPPDLAPLFDLGDEPLFHEATPFEVRPVGPEQADRARFRPLGPEPGSAAADTVVEALVPAPAGPPVDLIGDLADLGGSAPRPDRDPVSERAPTDAARPHPRSDPPPPAAAHPLPGPSGRGRTSAGAAEASPESAWTGAPPGPSGPVRTSAGAGSGVDDGGSTPMRPAEPTAIAESLDPEAARPTIPLTAAFPTGPASAEPARLGPPEGRLAIVSPPPNVRRIVLAVLGIVAMLLYAAALVLLSFDALAPWWSAPKVEAPSPTPAGAPTPGS